MTTRNRTWLTLRDQWCCLMCAATNDPYDDRCWECGADIDGEYEDEEERE